MDLNLEELRILIKGTNRLENVYRKKENDRHGEPVTELRKLDRQTLRNILALQERLIIAKNLLENSK